jgi:hypothetical protein
MSVELVIFSMLNKRSEDALETTEDDSVIRTMETSLGKGNIELKKDK